MHSFLSANACGRRAVEVAWLVGDSLRWLESRDLQALVQPDLLRSQASAACDPPSGRRRIASLGPRRSAQAVSIVCSRTVNGDAILADMRPFEVEGHCNRLSICLFALDKTAFVSLAVN